MKVLHHCSYNLLYIIFIFRVPESWPDDPLAGPENLSEMVPGIPDRIDGAFYSEKSDAIYFFRHDLSWKVKSSEVAEGYPKPIMEEWGIGGYAAFFLKDFLSFQKQYSDAEFHVVSV